MARSAGPAAPATAPQSALRAVAVPSEHGGWGLTIEPGLLGLLIAPSWAGLWLALAALVAFVARTPLKVALVGLWRRRLLPSARLAAIVAGTEFALLALLMMAATVTADNGSWWVPMVAAVPLLAIELSFDMRSRSRRLVPQLAGSIAIASVAAAIVIAADEPRRLAYGLWAVLAARALASIPHVRHLIQRLHHRPTSPAVTLAGDVMAVAAAVGAVALDRALAVGATAIVVLVAVQRVTERRQPRPPKIVGVQQSLFGLTIVLLTALGAALG